MGFALKYQGSCTSTSHPFQYRRKSELPASPVNLATTSLQVWTHYFIFTFPYFLVYGMGGTLPLSTFLFLSFMLSSPRAEGKPFLQRNAEDDPQIGGDQSTCVSFSWAEREAELLDEGSPYMPKVGTARPLKTGRGTLPPGRAPHPKSLFKDSRLSKHPPSFSSSK